MLENCYGATFFYFFSLIENFEMGDMLQTYGSDGFRVQFLRDEGGN